MKTRGGPKLIPRKRGFRAKPVQLLQVVRAPLSKSSGTEHLAGDSTACYCRSRPPTTSFRALYNPFVPRILRHVFLSMRFGTVAAMVAAAFLGTSTAHNIQLKAHSRECFHEELHRDDKMTVTFQVGDREFAGAGNLDIDFYVCNNLSLQARALTAADNGPFKQLRDPDVDSIIRRLLIRCEERWEIFILLQQREMVCQLERGVIQCTWHCLCPRVGDARRSARFRR